MEDKTFNISAVKNRLVARFFARHPFLLKRWLRKADIIQFKNTPWAPVTKKITRSRLALVTTGGVHLKSQKPFDMSDPAGDPTFREIPRDAAPRDLIITHDYYDHRDADEDVNIVLPIETVRRLEKTAEIGSINARHFSFMGHITAPHVETLIGQTAPEVAGALISDHVDLVILTPAWGLCNQSVGLIQRIIEAAGIPTMSISLSREITGKVRPPRAWYPGLPLGHPLGFPGQPFLQLQVVRLLLKYLKEIDTPGTMVDRILLHPYDASAECNTCAA